MTTTDVPAPRRPAPRRCATVVLIVVAVALLVAAAVGAAAGTYALTAPRLAPSPAPTPSPTPSSIGLRQLAAGHCLPRQLGDAGGWGTDVIDCLAPHRAEVYAAFDLVAPRYPQTPQAVAQAQKICKTALPGQLAAEVGTTTTLEVWLPDKEDYDYKSDKNAIVCAVSLKTGTWTGHHDNRFT